MGTDWESVPRVAEGLPIRSAEAAAATIAADATLAVSGFGSVGYPKVVPLALAGSDQECSLTVISGGAVGDEIDTELAAADAVARRYPFATRDAIRDRANDGRTAFHDRHVSVMSDEVRFGGLPSPDVAVVEAVAVGEDWLIPSTSIGSTPAYVAAADRLIVEVNAAQPRGLAAFHDNYLRNPPPEREPLQLEAVDGRIGSSRIAFDSEKLDGVVRTDRPDATYEFREPSPAVRQLARNLADFIEAELADNSVLSDALTLEFGVGSLGNALTAALADIDAGDRDVRYFGEVIQDGLLDAIDAGEIAAASGTSLALSEDGQRQLFDDIDRYAESIVLRPADISNSAALIDRFGVVGINAAVEVDCYGHVNSTHLRGAELVGGIGGSGDFARNAHLSIVALPATAADGELSRIVPMATHVDHTEHDVDVVVTDQGVADLRRLSPRERAEQLVACAHPDFADALRQYVDRAGAAGGHVPHDLETAFDWR